MKNIKSFLSTLSAIIMISCTIQGINFKKAFKEAPVPLKSVICASAYATTATGALIVNFSILPRCEIALARYAIPHKTAMKMANIFDIATTNIACLSAYPFASLDRTIQEIKYGLKNKTVLKITAKNVVLESIPATIAFGIIPLALHKYLEETSTDTSITNADEFLQPKEKTEN